MCKCASIPHSLCVPRQQHRCYTMPRAAGEAPSTPTRMSERSRRPRAAGTPRRARRRSGWASPDARAARDDEPAFQVRTFCAGPDPDSAAAVVYWQAWCNHSPQPSALLS